MLFPELLLLLTNQSNNIQQMAKLSIMFLAHSVYYSNQEVHGVLQKIYGG